LGINWLKEFKLKLVNRCIIKLNIWIITRQQDAVTAIRKARSSYIGRQQEYEKIKETALKAETENISLSGIGGTLAAKADARLEKKKKQEDDALQKVLNVIIQAYL